MLDYHVFLVHYITTELGVRSAEDDEEDTFYSDLFQGYPNKLRMAKDLARFVRYILV